MTMIQQINADSFNQNVSRPRWGEYQGFRCYFTLNKSHKSFVNDTHLIALDDFIFLFAILGKGSKKKLIILMENSTKGVPPP